MNGSIAKLCTAVTVILALGCGAFAQDDFPISGIYRAGRPCRVDDMSARAALITITDWQITHPGGVCTIDDARREGDTVVVRTTCKDRHGKVLSGEVSLTIRADKSLDMTALGGSYTAVLNRCPESPAPVQAGNQSEPVKTQ